MNRVHVPLWIVGSFSLQAYGTWTTRLVSVKESTNLLYALLTQYAIDTVGSICKFSHLVSDCKNIKMIVLGFQVRVEMQNL